MPYKFIHIWNLRKKTNELREKEKEETKNQTLTNREQTDGHQTGGGWRNGLNR